MAANYIKKLDRTARMLLEKWLNKHLVNCDNPGAFGKGLSANMVGLWRYRIGDYRLICERQDDKLIVLALSFGHRSRIYSEE